MNFFNLTVITSYHLLPSLTPEYLLSQPMTSLCQTSEFSGFNTHYQSVSRDGSSEL